MMLVKRLASIISVFFVKSSVFLNLLTSLASSMTGLTKSLTPYFSKKIARVMIGCQSSLSACNFCGS